MRLFTAISLPNEFIDDFKNITLNSKIRGDLNWTKPENLHITTCFIGETEKGSMKDVIDKVSTISKGAPVFRLEFRNIQLAPPKKKPYMIWANYNTNEIYTNLCDQLHEELLTLSKRNHYPHVTLARFKGFVRFNSYEIQNTFPAVEVAKIGLWKSELTKTGPAYEKLEEFSLGSL